MNQLTVANVFTSIHRANLIRLQHGLLDFVKNNLNEWWHPRLNARFNMAVFSDSIDEEETCGSVGCALGFATEFVRRKHKYQSWRAFAEEIFGIDSAKSGFKQPDLEFHRSLWSWLFDASWSSGDGTPHGAAKRIQWLLDGKDLPPKIYSIACGFTALPY